MKILLCDLLLLSVLASVFSSCPRDCLTCQETLGPDLEGFSLEGCLLARREKVFPARTRCAQVPAGASGARLLRRPRAPEPQQLQKRFGGFTGARKSARKLAHQKRVSEFVRQYLVLSLQSSQRRRAPRHNGNE